MALAPHWKVPTLLLYAGDDRLVNTFGEVFQANVGDVEDAAPAKAARPEGRRTQNPRNRAFGAKKSGQGAGGPKRGQAQGGQPDPMKTSVGYIGAESFNRLKKTPGGPGRGGRGGGGRSR